MTAFLSDRAIGQLREIARRVLREEVGRLIDQKSGRFTGLNTFVVQASTSGISGRSTGGNDPGSGTVTIFFRSTGNTLTATTETTTVYNLSATPVENSNYATAVQDVYGSLWIDGSGEQVQFGRPQTAHGSGETETYDLVQINSAGTNWVDRGVTQSGVFQRSGYTFATSVVHMIVKTQGAGSFTHHAFPVELLDCEGGELNIGERSKLTISGGVVTKTGSFHRIETEASAATDDLDTINGGTEGDFLVVSAFDGAETVVMKDGTGNLRLEGDFSMDTSQDTITLVFNGTNWQELSRSNNN